MSTAPVTEVIPTRGRSELVVRAVRSALAQTLPPQEIIVVIDGPDAATEASLGEVSDPTVRVIQHPSSKGAGAARNTGVEHATGDLIAFLDDDDVWYPRKLELQLPLHQSAADPDLVVSATAAEVDHRGQVVVWPLRVPRPDEGIPEYLFVRRRAGEGALFTPSLMVSRRTALAVPMPTHLRTHEEWDWLLTLHTRGVRAVVELTPLGRFDTAPRRASVSSGATWRDSLEWARARRGDLGPRAYSAFVLTEVGRAANLADLPLADQRRILAEALRGRPRVWDLGRHLLRPLVTRLRRG